MMQTPDNPDWDKGLKELLQPNNDIVPTSGTGCRDFNAHDKDYLRDMIVAATHPGASAIFVIEHPDGRLEYLIANAARGRAIGLAADFIKRQTELL